MKSIKFFVNMLGLAAFVFILSCGSLNNKTIKNPCSGGKYLSSKNTFRASGIGDSKDQATSKKVALSNARAELASIINVTMKNVEDNFVNRLQTDNDETIREKFTGNIRTVLNQKLSGSITTCEEYKFNKKTLMYNTYVSVELSAKALADQIAKNMSTDEEIKVEFDYQNFQETFNSEMDKFENSK